MTIAIAGYQILEKLHESKHSLIYRGYRDYDHCPVILKQLKAEYPTPEQLTRYKQEYEITRTLDSPGVIQAYSLEKHQNTPIIVVEDFGGQSLQQFVSANPLNLEEFLNLAIKIAEILAEIHAANIIHKDINPANIVINPETDQLKIIDFGISTRLSQENPILQNLDVLEGTLAYLSPEQTGRMNRTLDYRTDFYSLGITFYELLLQQLPFDAEDTLELIHCHIAKQPTPPHQLKPDIPKAISDIVMKLLAKTAEERYQSAWGLQADLVLCLMQLEANDEIEEIIPGENDISDKFKIPQKLYGRDWAIEQLLAAFERNSNQTIEYPENTESEATERNSQNKNEIVLISGHSGIGKSALVQEIHKPITQKKGYFITGKFDQLQRDIPYSAVIKAFQKLIQQLLAESEEKLERWREEILTALGPNGQVIVNVIPEVELITGKQKPVPNLTPSESKNRFKLTFKNFIKVFTQPEHPLAIFLDDLQWADSASLQFIQLLNSTSHSQNLFLIGAYRDNEVNGTHPLLLTLEKIQKSGTKIHEISLDPLDLSNINQLISDTLSCTLKRAKPLAELVLAKTNGNPFFLNEFLKSLYAEKLLVFDSQSRSWQWDLKKIKSQEITANVVELMAEKIKKLSIDTQNKLQLAACIGNQFKLETLAIVSKQSQKETALSLREAILEGLILPLNSAYKAVELGINYYPQRSKTEDSSANLSSEKTTKNFVFGDKPLKKKSNPIVEYKFAHDRIQQAAYFLISDSSRQIVHLQLGMLLLQNISTNRQEEKIFDIVNQLNFGIEIINNQTQLNGCASDLNGELESFNSLLSKQDLAQLNLIAGQKAKAAAAYKSAFKYFNIGVELLDLRSWETQYELTLSLYESAAEAAYLSGNFEQMEQWIVQVLKQAKTPLDTVKVYDVKIQAYIAQSQLREAILAPMPLLRQLGIKFPAKPTKVNALLGLFKMKLALMGKKISELANLPEMTDPVQLAAISILCRISSAAYNTMPKLMPLIVLKMVSLSIQYGNTSISAFAYAGYGLVLCSVGDIESGYQFGQLALEVLNKLNAKAIEAKTIAVVNSLLRPWKEPWNNSLEPLQLTYQKALETGDFEFAARSACVYFHYAHFVGKELAGLEQEIVRYSETIRQLKQETFAYRIEIYRQSIFNLRNISGNPGKLVGEFYNEEKLLSQHQQANDRNLLFHLHLTKLILYCLFQDYPNAVKNADLAEQYLDGVTGGTVIIALYFYGSLARLSVHDFSNEKRQKKLLEDVAAKQKKMKQWMQHTPINCLHKFYLVEAEYHRVCDRADQAMALYDRAIETAKKHEFLNEVALANELAARFYLGQDKPKFAQVYLQEAWYCYMSWGALAKVEVLNQQYPHLLISKVDSRLDVGAQSTRTTIMPTTRQPGSLLDLATVMKASQTISSEIVLDKLLENLMKISIENAGAQRGCLILPRDGKLLVQAAASVESSDIAVLQSILVESDRTLPAGVIHYVARTHSDVVLGDAVNEGQFTNDPYIVDRKLKSVLCTPLLNQGKLVGIFYLENNLIADAFTPNRIEVLKLLCSQAAVSLENALLYASLEQKVAARTQEINEKNLRLEHTLQELKRTQTQLIQTEKMSGLGQMVAGVAHEINNPISFIYGNLDHASDYYRDLLSLLKAYQQEYPNSSVSIQEMAEDIDLDFLTEDLQNLLDSMRTGADRIRKIVASLRDFSHLDESEMKLVDIHAGIDNTLLVLQHRLNANRLGIPINVVKEYGDLPRVTCYASQLNQVFMNILNNAIDALGTLHGGPGEPAMEAGQSGNLFAPTITIRTEVGDVNQVKIRIADNGPGIPEAVKQQIFDPFFTTKPVGSGTGLGLSVCYQVVVEKHGGQLTCDSLPGEGAAFAIAIPLHPMKPEIG